MPPERRNDIGSKVSYAILTALIALTLTVLFNQSHGLALTALSKASEVEIKETKSETCLLSVGSDISEIKTDMKKVLAHVAREAQVAGHPID